MPGGMSFELTEDQELIRKSVAELAGKFGASLSQIFWTMGAYDAVGIVQAPDDESATAFAVALSSQGNVRTTTMRAFDAGEMRQVLAKASA